MALRATHLFRRVGLATVVYVAVLIGVRSAAPSIVRGLYSLAEATDVIERYADQPDAVSIGGRNFAAPRWLSVVAGIVIAVAATLPAFVVACLVYHTLTRRHAVSDRQTRCGQCGYILKGLTEPRCPECGERI